MTRIKGVNSDYRYEDGAIRETGVETAYLRLFLCPYDMPSHVEPPLPNGEPSGWCEGQDEACPHEGARAGHTLIYLHEHQGIKLITDKNNALIIDQQGNIRLCPTDEGRAEVNGLFVVQRRDGSELLLEISEERIVLQVAGGAKVCLRENGSIELFTANNSGQVTVHGNLLVTGEVVTGSNGPHPGQNGSAKNGNGSETWPINSTKLIST